MIKIKLLENESVQFLVDAESLDEIKNETEIFKEALRKRGYHFMHDIEKNRFEVSVEQFDSIYNISDIFKNESDENKSDEHASATLLTFQFEVQKPLKPTGKVEAFFDPPKKESLYKNAEELIIEKIAMNDRIKHSRF